MSATTSSPFFDPPFTPQQCAMRLYKLFMFGQCNGTEYASQLDPADCRDFGELVELGMLCSFAEDLKREAVRSGIPLETEILAEVSFASLVLGEPLPQPTRDRLNRLAGVAWAWVVRLDGIAARDPATTPGAAHAVTPEQARKKPKIPRKDAEILVRNHLLKCAKDDPGSITARGVSQATGVSLGMIPSLSPWIVFEEKRKELRQENGTLRTIPLTPALLASISNGSDDPLAEAIRNEELQKQIEEQEEEEGEADRQAAIWERGQKKRSRRRARRRPDE